LGETTRELVDDMHRFASEVMPAFVGTR
jgi:hypothetical protein